MNRKGKIRFVAQWQPDVLCVYANYTSLFPPTHYLPDGTYCFTLTFYLLTELLASTSDVTGSSV